MTKSHLPHPPGEKTLSGLSDVPPKVHLILQRVLQMWNCHSGQRSVNWDSIVSQRIISNAVTKGVTSFFFPSFFFLMLDWFQFSCYSTIIQLLEKFWVWYYILFLVWVWCCEIMPFSSFFFFLSKEMLPTPSLSMLLFAFWYLHIRELLQSGIYDLQSVAISIVFWFANRIHLLVCIFLVCFLMFD